MEISFHRPGSVERKALEYVVIGAREGKNWIFVKNRGRSSWELPAGHIEEGESPREAALRELWEESGAKGVPKHLAEYSVKEGHKIGYGSLFLVMVEKREALPDFETTKVLLSPTLPEDLGFAAVQKVLFERLQCSLRS